MVKKSQRLQIFKKKIVSCHVHCSNQYISKWCYVTRICLIFASTRSEKGSARGRSSSRDSFPVAPWIGSSAGRKRRWSQWPTTSCPSTTSGVRRRWSAKWFRAWVSSTTASPNPASSTSRGSSKNFFFLLKYHLHQIERFWPKLLNVRI